MATCATVTCGPPCPDDYPCIPSRGGHPLAAEQKMQARVVTDNLAPLGHLLEQSHSWPELTQIVFASSVAAYGWTREVLREDAPKRPVDLYGATKLAGEDLYSLPRPGGCA